MRELYIKIIKRYIESKQMRDYLVSIVDKLQKWQIIELICGARAGIKDKIDSLLWLSEFETDDEKKDENSAYYTAKIGKRFLDELVLKQGEVFLNMEYGYDDEKAEEKIWGAAPHFSVKSIIKYVNEEYEELDEKEKQDALYWYRLEKYAPQNGDDELDWRCYYTVAPNGEIWYSRDLKKDEGRSFDDSQDLNLPVPFEIGDMITIDCRPFAPVKHAVILEKGNNWGCCSVQCVWISENGKIRTGALKHSTLFDDKSFIRVSPLYRAELLDGKLSPEEQPLKEISKFVYRNEEKGKNFGKYIFDTDKRGKGLKFENIQKYIKKVATGI